MVPPSPNQGRSQPKETQLLRTADRDWSKDNIKTLKAAWKDPTIRIADLAADLGRSDGAVRQKAHALGLKRRGRSKPKTKGLKAAASRKKSSRRASR